MKVRVRNFQILKDVELEFSPGITLISGPNSSGKSSLFRAIRAALLNSTSAKQFIAHGEKEARVDLEVGGKCLEWVRTEKAATYCLQGQLLEKLGRSKVWDHDPSFPLGQGSEGETLNFQTEWDCLFPFSRNGSQMYALLEEIFDLGDSKEVFVQIKRDISQSKADIEAALIPINEAREWLALHERLPSTKAVDHFTTTKLRIDAERVNAERVFELDKSARALDKIPAPNKSEMVWGALELSPLLHIAERELPSSCQAEPEMFEYINQTQEIARKVRKVPEKCAVPELPVTYVLEAEKLLSKRITVPRACEIVEREIEYAFEASLICRKIKFLPGALFVREDSFDFVVGVAGMLSELGKLLEEKKRVSVEYEKKMAGLPEVCPLCGKI